ncbi:MAG TPA: ClpXP protease specificity-enhancing factor SspB [Stellaceae bacterium]|nr:ClpXP protease specificity-enhancing factor SspB [Stellaceae bacterium]HUC11191.1 ClpXP protease specificity-enhancing factor SspB [Stellaceae bacterium]
MAQDLFQYEKMVETALRGVVREALSRVARDGLRGGHHFYITFRTTAPGVVLPPQLLAKFPEEMTIVLQHQFWGLAIGEHAFSVTLSFSSRMEQLTIPFAAITAFADPSVKFGLQFQMPAATPTEPSEVVSSATPAAALPLGEKKEGERQEAEIVTLDRFRKR